MSKIRVHLDRRESSSYDIYIGEGVLDQLGPVIAKERWGDHAFMITDEKVAHLHGERVTGALRSCGIPVDMITIPQGEVTKDIKTPIRICERLLEMGGDRRSLLVALGGGVVGDITGFCASIFMRGVPYIQVPTTLLAQVDSSIGGKTGVDLPMAKNIIGTFYQPKGVFIDLAFLETLDDREMKNGLAEVIKYGVIDDPILFATVERQGGAILEKDYKVLMEVVTRSCQIKKGIVEIDERERGLRRILNFGHTIGHAIEAASGYTIPHGDAVAIGMVAASSISERMQFLPAEDRRRICDLIQGVGLTTRVPKGITTEAVIDAMKGDKKRRGGKLHFVLLKRIGLPFVTGEVPEVLIRETVEGLSR